MTAPIRILELRTVRGTGGGPEKTILLGSARTDRTRFAVTVCYVRDARDQVFAIDAKAAQLPIDYIEIVEARSLDPSVLPRLRRIVRERAIDIVHAHDYKTNLLAWLLAKFENVTPLATAHGWTGHTARERWAYYPADKKVLARFPAVIAVSNEIRAELVRTGTAPDRIVTVLNGIDHMAFNRDKSRNAGARARLGCASGEFVIGAVGRLEPQKRFDVLIEAFAEIHNQYPWARLLIAGDGSLANALCERANALGLGNACRLLGHRTDISELHHAFDLFVQSSDYEGTPNAVLEAMAFETPIVATDAGGTAELVRDGRDGLIVAAGDARRLASAIATVLGDPVAAAARARSARRRVETDLSFDARMRAVESVYLDLVGHRRGGAPAEMAPARQ